jgi:hypothetical protein
MNHLWMQYSGHNLILVIKHCYSRIMEPDLRRRFNLLQFESMQTIADLHSKMAAAIQLLDDDFDFLYQYSNLLSPNPPRNGRFQSLRRPHGSIWTAMSGDTSLWASYGPEVENEKYYECFRMDKQGFDYIFSKIKGEFRINRLFKFGRVVNCQGVSAADHHLARVYG